MKALRAACGQFRASLESTSPNVQAIIGQAEEARRRGCSIIVFPEMALTGYLPPAEMPGLAEPADGPSSGRISEAARRIGIAIVYGFPELDPSSGEHYNSFLVVDSRGETAAVYHKVHLWDTEARWAKPGDGAPLFRIEQTPMTGWICYDTRFPELARLGFLQGAEVALVPTAWLGPPDEWDLALRARAQDNSMFALGSDLINLHPDLPCRGLSMIVDPYGRVLARAQPHTDCVIDALLDPALLNAQRTRVPLARDRRPRLYRELAQ